MENNPSTAKNPPMAIIPLTILQNSSIFDGGTTLLFKGTYFKSDYFKYPYLCQKKQANYCRSDVLLRRNTKTKKNQTSASFWLDDNYIEFSTTSDTIKVKFGANSLLENKLPQLVKHVRETLFPAVGFAEKSATMERVDIHLDFLDNYSFRSGQILQGYIPGEPYPYFSWNGREQRVQNVYTPTYNNVPSSSFYVPGRPSNLRAFFKLYDKSKELISEGNIDKQEAYYNALPQEIKIRYNENCWKCLKEVQILRLEWSLRRSCFSRFEIPLVAYDDFMENLVSLANHLVAKMMVVHKDPRDTGNKTDNLSDWWAGTVIPAMLQKARQEGAVCNTIQPLKRRRVAKYPNLDTNYKRIVSLFGTHLSVLCSDTLNEASLQSVLTKFIADVRNVVDLPAPPPPPKPATHTFFPVLSKEQFAYFKECERAYTILPKKEALIASLKRDLKQTKQDLDSAKKYITYLQTNNVQPAPSLLDDEDNIPF